jgi:hypothetical protein
MAGDAHPGLVAHGPRRAVLPGDAQKWSAGVCGKAGTSEDLGDDIGLGNCVSFMLAHGCCARRRLVPAYSARSLGLIRNQSRRSRYAVISAAPDT